MTIFPSHPMGLIWDCRYSLSQHINRRSVLEELHNSLIAPKDDDEQKLRKIVSYIQTNIFHPPLPPCYSDRQAVLDPYLIMKHRVGHCGQLNRLLIDLLEAAGISSRVVQLVDHQAAETRINNKWCFVDAHFLPINSWIYNGCGQIASVSEILETPELIGDIHDCARWTTRAAKKPPFPRRPYSRFFERRLWHVIIAPYTYIKTATAEECQNRFYGWNHYETIETWN